MSHLLSTSNPDEAARLQEAVAADVMSGPEGFVAPEPAEPAWRDGDPDVGDWVIYQPRRGSIRRGRNRVAALVVYRHPHARLLDLAIFYEANDTLDDQRVPEAEGAERGWLVKNAPVAAAPIMARYREERRAQDEITELRQDVAKLSALILGGFERPEHSVLELLSMLDERVDKLERSAPKPKRRYTRKAKPEPKVETKTD